MLKDWRAQGYPFAQIIPSYATAIGSSGDRSDVLARLMGIILNDGLDVPITNVERVAFANSTPFETELGYSSPKVPARVFAPEVARTLKRTLASVVNGGTAIRQYRTLGVESQYRVRDPFKLRTVHRGENG